MISLHVDDAAAIPLSVDSSSAVSMTVSEAFIDRGGSAIQNNKNATPSTSQVVVTPDPGFDGMAKVTVAAMPQGALDDMDINFDTSTGHFTASAGVATSGYIADTASVSGGFQLATQAAATITPTTVQRQAVAAHKWTTGAVMVDPIPSEYIIPTGTKSIAANGTGIDVKAYEKVDVAVPGITPSGTLAIATNGSHDVTNYATASVSVPASAVDTGTKSITANGNGQDVVGYAAVNVNVPNSYAAADEGKVVSNCALVAQTSDTVTTNDTYDTTLINSLTVNVSGGGGGATKIADGTFVGNGDYTLDLFVGKKCPQTDFIFNIWVDNGTQMTPDSSTTRLLVILQIVVNKMFSTVDLSSDGNKSKTNLMTYPTYNSNDFTNRTPSTSASAASYVRMTTDALEGNYFSYIKRNSSGFTFHFQKSSQYKYQSGITYNWELLYFGSDSANDIVEVS